MSDLTASEVKRRCEELVYKVAYSFYDAPYIIILRLLVVRTA
jgi:transcription initiation factor TFIIE subunit alpha